MYTPFKMKGKSPMMKALIGNQGNLNAGLRASIEAAPESPAMMKKAPTKMKKESSMKMMDKKSPTKLTGKERRAAIEKAKSATYDSPRAKRKAVLEARRTANKAFFAAKKKKVVKAVSNVNEKIQTGAKNLSDKLKSKKKVVIIKNDKIDKGDKGNKSVEGTGKYKGNKYSTDSKTGKTTVTTKDGKKITTSKDVSEYTNKNNKSNTRVEFNKAFKAASNSGKKTFTFKGKSYTTTKKK
tara:strand:+ start:25 stop:741 length:717 start_codon:yes stop_codon:yes gene_type:complete